MTRDRLATEELAGVLDLLKEVQQASALSVSAPPRPPPRKATTAAQPSPAAANQLFGAVRVDGEDQLGRSAAEDKIAILRRKVRALEDRLHAVEEAWNVRETELDQAKQDARDEKQRREDAEEAVRKLNAFLQEKKKEIEAYHGRVQEALREQLRREQEAAREHARREQQLIEEQAQREQKALRDHARRQQELIEEQAQREQKALREHALVEQETQREQARHEQQLIERAERAEREVAALRQPAPPPPPPPLTLGDIEELAQHITVAARAITAILKGRVDPDEGTQALRKALRVLKTSYDLLAAAQREAQEADQ